MAVDLYDLIERARRVRMTQAQREQQAISFAYGNVHLENDRVTREIVRRAAIRLKQGHGPTG